MQLGFLAALAPLVTMVPAQGVWGSPVMTAMGAAMFPFLSTADLAGEWHSTFAGDTGVLAPITQQPGYTAAAPYTTIGGSAVEFAAGLQPQAITCPDAAVGVPVGGSGPLRCVASSGLPLIYSPVNAAVCTTNQSAFFPLSAGVCAFAVSQPGNAVYATAPSVIYNALATALVGAMGS